MIPGLRMSSELLLKLFGPDSGDGLLKGGI